MKYLKIILPIKETQEKDKSFYKKIIYKILKIILPISNPDYENEIEKVRIWLLEFEDSTYPIREIGLDEEGEVIVKMPYNKNYGYWTDNEMCYDDFINNFLAENIDSNLFEEKWNSL